MSDVTVTGSHLSALTHFAGYGLAGILADAGAGRVRLCWSDAARPRLTVASDLSRDEVGEAVRRHAEAAVVEGSWLNAVIDGGSRAGFRLYSPRFKPPELDEWESIMRQRDERFPGGHLDAEMIVGLGEPAWWRQAEGDSPDSGASRWEMKTRNKGAEVIADRLAPLAREVSGWVSAAIVDGIEGLRVDDAVGKGASDSRSATGFRQPGPTDNALAWCALWGIAATRPVRRAAGMAQTAGTSPRRRTHPTVAALPVWTVPVSLTVVRRVLVSSVFDVAAFTEDPVTRAPAVRRLSVWGVRGIVRFPILKTGSSSAPERQILTGELHVLDVP